MWVYKKVFEGDLGALYALSRAECLRVLNAFFVVIFDNVFLQSLFDVELVMISVGDPYEWVAAFM